MKAGHKPGSVHSFSFRNRMGNHLSGTNVTDSLKRLSVGTRSLASIAPRLAPSRGLPSQHLSMLLVRSYRTFAPLPCLMGSLLPYSIRRCISVALSSRSPALGITQQAWPNRSPDFPQLNSSAKAEVQLRSPPLLSTPSCLKA